MSHDRGEFEAEIEHHDGFGVGSKKAKITWDYSRTVDILTVFADGQEVFIGGPGLSDAVKRAIEQSEES